jgi:hypothetical protein
MSAIKLRVRCLGWLLLGDLSAPDIGGGRIDHVINSRCSILALRGMLLLKLSFGEV